MMEVAEQRKQQALSAALRNQKNDNIFSTALPMEGRLTFLPARVTPEGKEWAVPGALAAAWNAFTAPRRAIEGKLEDPVEEALNVAGMAMTGAMPFSAPAGSLGMNVWHGSPHKFDKFDASKIGTGEGAQAYGHGLYLAESPEVASQYRKQLAGWPKEAKNIVNEVSNLGITDDAAREVLSLAASVGRKEFDIDTAAKWLGYRSRELRDLSDAQRKEILLRMSQVETPGSIYKVDLPDEQIAKMLDWDKPLSQQSQEIQSIAKNLGLSLDDLGGDLVAAANAKLPKGAEQLRQAGIPGIKYYDAQSRGGQQATAQNFVVFPGNEELLKILERNGGLLD